MVYFWLKFLHIATVAIWFAGLFFLPRLFLARTGGETADPGHFNALGRALYFQVTTPAAVLAVVFGTLLIAWGVTGPWLAAKLVLVGLAVLLHLYCGQLLLRLSRGQPGHSRPVYQLLNWTPLVLFLGIAALAAAKPDNLPPLGPL